MKSKNIKVSVVMITFNHENYIREAIEGVLMQETDFEMELIISNDCSTDATNIVIEDFLLNHPNAFKVKYFNQEKNLGMMPNFIFTLNQSKGNYIAICEGDDYWTDTYKLQKQVDFLEANPEYVIHGGDAFFHRGKELTNKKVIGATENKIRITL
jgi:glycosyltransferase involved in cell wall biosynthesis